MKALFAALPFFLLSFSSLSQEVVGYWKTMDDETGEAKSIVQIYKGSDGHYHGKIVRLFRQPNEDQDPVCTKCPKGDVRHGQKINGMLIVSALKKSGNEYSGGEILDPKNGKSYSCKIWPEGKDKLKVRGYLGIFYRTQTWHRTDL